MDLNTDSKMLSSHAAFEESMSAQEPSPSGSHSQTESGEAILIELLEFKTHLLEVVEELHIRRDAETRFEDQIRELVLEKQELEWVKEALQQQIDTRTKQHTDSLTAVNKQFQVKLQQLEVEKGKYQVAAELKDKESNNLKEELKSLQLLKYNLEKKSSELEQKLALQSRTKDTHLNQLGEVEKRFRTLSRQCAMVKQAHEKLQQNVDEAMRINNKLTSVNQKQEETIVTLKKKLDEVGYKLIKEKMKSVINEKGLSPTARDQNLLEQQQKLQLETETNKKLRKENVAERAEKQELVKSLQKNQQLLLNQTQTVRRLELELQTQREMFQALKQEHEVMREKSKAMEGKLVQLTESYSASKTSWDKERTKFLDQLKSEQKDLKVVREAYEDLHQKHVELSEQTRSQHTYQEEMKDGTQSHCISTKKFPVMLEDVRDEESLEDHLQHSGSSQAKTVDHLRDTGASFKLAASRATGGQDVQSNQQQPQKIKHILNHPNTFSDTSADCMSLLNNSEASIEMEILEKNTRKCETRDLIVSDDHQGASNPECGSADLLTKDTQVKDGRNAEEEEEEEEGVITAQTAEGTAMHEDTEGSAKAAGETSNPETEIRDKRDGELTDGVKERGHTTSDSLIQAPTISDTTEKSQTLQVNDCMDTELPPTVCELSSSSESLSQKVTDTHEDCNHSNKRFTVRRKECQICSDKQQRVSNKSNSDTANVQPDLEEVQTSCQDSEQSSSVCHENPSKATAGDSSAECSEILKQSSTHISRTDAAQSEDNRVQERETPTGTRSPSHIISITRKSDEKFDARVSADCVLMTNMTEPQPEGPETSEQQRAQHFQLNVNTRENSAAQIPDAMEDPAVTAGNTQEEVKTEEVTTTVDDLEISDEPSHENRNLQETDGSKHPRHQSLKHIPLSDPSEGFLSPRKTPRSLFEHSSTQGRTSSSRTNPDISKLQGTPLFGPNRTGRSLTRPTFIKSKHNKVPLVITRASDLFDPSSVPGAAAYSKIQQQEEKLGEGKEKTCRETAAADTDKRALSSFSSLLVSSSGSKESRLSSSEFSRAAAGPSSESDQELPWSQKGEDQRSSFRAQISRIEQFLNNERLHLPKRGRTDN